MPERLKIVILEDNLDRRGHMSNCLVDRFSQYHVQFFHTASEMIVYLRQHFGEVLLISLDHDLEIIPITAHRNADPGTGRDLSEFLAGELPCCPVIVHTTNGPAAFAMVDDLAEAGWQVERVIPFDDFKWISRLWFPVVRNAIVDAVGTAGVPAENASRRTPPDPLLTPIYNADSQQGSS